MGYGERYFCGLKMKRQKYLFSSILSDYLRSMLGLTVCGFLIIVSGVHIVVLYILGMLILLFVTYAIRTVCRHFTSISFDRDCLQVYIGVWLWREIKWSRVAGIKMRYFSTRRDKTGGWLQLIVLDGDTKISFDSHLENFAVFAERALSIAVEKKLSLNPTTLENFKSINLDAEVLR